MKFNEKLKYFREKKGYTQEDLASELLISRQSISKWENGINEPDLETIKKLCQIFDCSLAELIDDDKTVVSSKEVKVEEKKKKLLHGLIGVLIASVFLIVALVFAMDKEVVIHISSNMTKTMGSRYTYLFLILVNAFIFGLNILCLFSLGKSKYIKEKIITYYVMCLVLQIVVAIAMVVVTIVVVGFKIDAISNMIPSLLFSIIISASIFSHSYFNKRNPMFGFRTTYTLSSVDAWNRCNNVASYVLTSFALVGYVVSIIMNKSNFAFISIFIIFIPLFILLIYQEIDKKKHTGSMSK